MCKIISSQIESNTAVQWIPTSLPAVKQIGVADFRTLKGISIVKLMLIVLISWFAVTYAQDSSRDSYPEVLGLYETHALNQHTLAGGIADDCYSTQYVNEYRILSFTVLLRDPYNKDHLNFAFPVSLFVFFATFNPEVMEESTLFKVALSLLSSQHHFYLWNKPLNRYHQKSQFVSLFFRHNVEWFAFRSQQWIEFTPGLGIAFYFPADYVRFSLRFAVARKIETDFKVPRYSTIYFIQFCGLSRS